MRRFVLVFALVSTCGSSERPSSGSEAPTTRAERWDFNTPELDLYTGLDIRIVPTDAGASLGELIIDGHATGQQWAVGHPTRVDATGDGRQLLYGRVGLSAADMGLFVWEPERASLTALGEIARVEVLTGPRLASFADGRLLLARMSLSADQPRAVGARVHRRRYRRDPPARRGPGLVDGNRQLLARAAPGGVRRRVR